jgi:hypothetical protein
MTFDKIDFLIIGAAKSATTALQRALQRDPSIFMPDPELHFFSREYERGHDWYLSQFSKATPGTVAGEKSNSYLDTQAASSRIRHLLPHAKLIAQLRSPVERAYSDYCMLYRRSQVGEDIGRQLDPRLAGESRFLQGGLYHEQLRRFYDLYPSDQIKVILYEEFSNDPVRQLNRVRHFIGLKGELSWSEGGARVKDKTAPMLSADVRRRLAWLKPVVGPFRGTTAFKSFRGMLAREVTYPKLSQELRNRLIDFYAPEVEKLGVLLGRDLSSWLSDKPADPLGDARS